MRGKLTYKIYTLGCKVNQYDSRQLAEKLDDLGWQRTDKNAAAAIINTCAVTKTAVHKDKRMINKARNENSQALIIVMGCWPETYRDELKNISADLILGTGKINNAVKYLSEKFNNKIIAGKNGAVISKAKSSDRSRYFIKIQDGCEQFCSYCIIPYARGPLKSRKPSEAINEIKSAVNSGYHEVVLSGIHLGLYGADFKKEKYYLFDLLGALVRLKGLDRIRLSSIEITEVNDNIVELVAANKKLCRHLHIPLQSGSNKILKLMKRPYSTDYFGKKIKQIKKLMPDIAITTDVIVGFPGETKKDFNDTYAFIKKISFSKLHIFPFSAHEKTPAFKLPGRVGDDEIKIRAQKLRQLGRELEKDYKKKFRGKELDVLLESKNRGKTEFYFDIDLEKQGISFKNCMPGKIIKIKYNN